MTDNAPPTSTPPSHHAGTDSSNAANQAHAGAGAMQPQRWGMNTLLGRYLYSACALVIVLIAAAWLAHAKVNQAARMNTNNLSERQNTSRELRNLSNELWVAANLLQGYMIVPTESARVTVRASLKSIENQAQSFADHARLRNQPGIRDQAEDITAQITLLSRELEKLMEIRADPLKVFPSMPIMIDRLNPVHTEIIAAASLAMNEAAEQPDDPQQRAIHNLFAEIRYNWVQRVSIFRLLISIRMGVFNVSFESTIKGHISNMKHYADLIQENLAKLSELDRRGVLGLQQSHSLTTMYQLLRDWEKGYEEVLVSYLSDSWRTDTPYLSGVVQPQFMRIWERLRVIENEIETLSTQDISATTVVADQVSKSLWLIAFLGLLVAGVGTGIFAFYIRRPLARMAAALKAEAMGLAGAPLPVAGTVETRMLVEAFEDMRRQVHTRQQRLETILDNTAEGIITFDRSGTIESFNKAAESLFGWDEAEVLNTSIAVLIASDTSENHSDYIEHFMRDEIQGLVGSEGEVVGRRKDGANFPMSIKITSVMIEGKLRYTALLANIAERKQLMENLRRLAEHDGLTGLYNRSYFLAELERIVGRTRRAEQTTCALLYIDLDQFKYVNDTLGHAAGDRLLTEVGTMLAKRVRKSDVVARLGGDEFTILTHDTTPELVSQVAESFRQHIVNHVFHYEGKVIDISCSIGAVLITPAILSPAEVMSQADLACHIAKRSGRNRIHVFSSEDTKDVRTMSLDIGWAHRLKRAIEQDRFVLALQPILSTRTRNIVASEVLVRLRDDNGEIILPGGFLPTAERFGLAADIDRWIIAHAIDMLASARLSDPRLHYAVNLSAQTLTSPGLAEFIAKKISERSLDPTALTFEITETAAIADIGIAVKFLSALQALGCKTALDDFGSGMSSFAYLKELPVDLVKIDGRFVDNLTQNPVDQAMVRAMNDIAHALGKETVAEFVENEESFQYLASLGVDYAQGFHLGRPALMANKTAPVASVQPKLKRDARF